MKDKSEVFATFLKLAPDEHAFKLAMLTLDEAVSCYSESNRPAFYLAYANGYLRWLLAGLAPLTAEQMRSVGNNAPRIEDGFMYEIEHVRPSLRIKLDSPLKP